MEQKVTKIEGMAVMLLKFGMALYKSLFYKTESFPSTLYRLCNFFVLRAKQGRSYQPSHGAEIASFQRGGSEYNNNNNNTSSEHELAHTTAHFCFLLHQMEVYFVCLFFVIVDISSLLCFCHLGQQFCVSFEWVKMDS